MRQSHLILSNAAITWATQILQLVPQLILVPFLIGTIGETGYGIYALVWSLLTSIDQLEKSLQSGVVKYSAGYWAQGRIEDVNRVVSSSFAYSLGLAALAGGGTLAAAALYPDASGQMSRALALVGATILLIIPLTPYIGVIQSRQRYYVGAVIATASKYASSAAVVAWFRLASPSVGALLAIMAGALILDRMAHVPIAYRLVPGLRNRLGLFSGAHFRALVGFGTATVLASLCLAANATGVRWLMGARVSMSFVAHLAIVLMPTLLMSQVVRAMTITAMPATSAYQATGNRDMLRELLIRGVRYTMALTLAAVLAAAFLVEDVLVAWVGADYAFLAPYALALVASSAFMLGNSIGHHMLKGLGELRTVVWIYFTGLVVVPFGLILGLIGARCNPYLAVTVGLAAGHGVCGALNGLGCVRAVGAGCRDLVVRGWGQPLAVAAGAGLVAFGLYGATNRETMLIRAVMAALAVTAHLGGCGYFIATKAERRQAAEMLNKAAKKIFAGRPRIGAGAGGE
ncbi:MAG TPA: hypothetical protein P5306_09140 [Kiritimatiellia bacterium]|nr:hypothetical protein [Kiritimatiellia bacterium]